MKKNLKLFTLFITLIIALTCFVNPIHADKDYVCKIGDTEYISINAALMHGGTDSAEKDPTTGESDTVSTNIVLIDNVNENISIPEGRNITLDLNGYVLKSALEGSVVSNAGKLTIIDSNNTKEHYFKYITDGVWEYVGESAPTDSGVDIAETLDAIDTDTTHVKVLGGCITGANTSNRGAGIYNAGTLILDGGNIVGNLGRGYYGAGVANVGTFIMDGGSIIGNRLTESYGGGGVANVAVFTMNAGNISYNSCANYGAGIMVLDYLTDCEAISFIMNGGSIDNNSAHCGGGICIRKYYSTLITIKITNGSISNNKSSGGGGGIYNVGADITITGGSINNNTTSDDGAGIYNENYKLDISGGSIESNTASNSGGGVYNRSGKLTISGGNIDDNVAINIGGGIYNYCGALNISDGSINRNEASTYGGGIFTVTGDDHTVVIKDSVISQNTARKGGGIYDTIASGGTGEGKIQITNSTVKDNKANKDDSNSFGGGIYNDRGEISISSSSVESNTATNSGGGIYNSNGVLIINASNIDSNEVNNSGGGLYSWTDENHSVSIKNDTFIKNNNAKYGGGVYNSSDNGYVNEGRMEIIDSTIKGNGVKEEETYSWGAGVYNANGTLIISGTCIENNEAREKGGAIFSWTNNNHSVTINNGSQIKNNTARYLGGGIYNSPQNGYVDEGKMNIIDSTISGNKAIYYNNSCGGGIFNDWGNLYVSDTSIINNETIYRGGGIDNENGVLTFKDGNIEENISNYGGGIYTCTNTDRTVIIYKDSKNTVIKNNFAYYDGGGIYNSNGMLTINGINIESNEAKYSCGGGIYSWTDTEHSVVITESTSIKSNTAQYGGGIYNSAEYSNSNPVASTGNMTISNCTISYNSAEGAIYNDSPSSWGGGIYNDAGILDINNSSINYNSADKNAGGIYNGNGNLNIAGGSIENNTAANTGGGIYTWTDVDHVASIYKGTIGTVIKGNNAQYGGGIYNSTDDGNDGQGRLDISDCTIVKNYSRWGSGLSSGGTLKLKDSRVTNNTITETQGDWKNDFGGAGIDWWGGKLTLSGKIVIYDNLTNDMQDNVFMEFDDNIDSYNDNRPINIETEGLYKGSEVGVIHHMTPSSDSPIQISTVNTTDLSEYFISDENDYYIRNDANVLKLAVATVKIAYGIENGKIVIDNQGAGVGETVSITAIANDGYKLDKITVTNSEGEFITINSNNEFVMPDDINKIPVTVSATFTRKIVIGNKYKSVKTAIDDFN